KLENQELKSLSVYGDNTTVLTSPLLTEVEMRRYSIFRGGKVDKNSYFWCYQLNVEHKINN
ncbi:unnamed protein product, partial [Callosobruchus maculatus]